jgi:Lar family restriction alleviation protein
MNADLIEKLLPCPFCGGKAVCSPADDSGEVVFAVACMNCEAQITKADEAGAIKQWNIRALTQADARIARLEEDRARYQWLANAVLCCDYGDNDQGGAESADRIGWAIRLTRRNAIPFIFGQSIDAAIDTALKGDI